MIGGPPVLDVAGVTVRYGGVVAVRDAGVVVDEGEIVALIGPNGAGKTSLFNAVAGTVAPAAGSVRLDGRRLDGLAPHQRARLGLGRTFQGGRLFGRLTLAENLEIACHGRGRRGFVSGLLGTPGARADRRRDAARAAEVIGALALEEYAATPCLALPYGIQRLAEIGRALCISPRVLLLDEPSAGLDPSESADLARMIRRIRDLLGVPVLLIEHDMSLVMSISDYVYVLDFGLPLAEGRPAEVRSDPKVVAAYLGDVDAA